MTKQDEEKFENRKFWVGVCMWAVMAYIESFIKPIPWPFYAFSVIVLGVEPSKVKEVIESVKSKKTS